MSKPTRFPPINPLPDEIVLTRRPLGQKIVLHFIDGDSYKLDVDEVERYLKLIGKELPGEITSCVWNFYAVHYDVRTQKVTVLPYTVAKEVLPSRVTLAPYVAVGSSGDL